MKSFKVWTLTVGLVTACLLLVSPTIAADQDRWPSTNVDKPKPRVEGIPPVLAKNLATFDELDFHVYTGQHWENLHKSHAQDIIVYYPDGHTTKGIPDHIKELNFMWTFAPDNRITEHHVRFGTAEGEWTAVMGYLDGTFTKPMVLPGGKVIRPTGKAHHLPMATLGHWNKQGTMDKEYLFWDNASLMTQIGAAN
jgi:hypothetical protein